MFYSQLVAGEQHKKRGIVVQKTPLYWIKTSAQNLPGRFSLYHVNRVEHAFVAFHERELFHGDWRKRKPFQPFFYHNVVEQPRPQKREWLKVRSIDESRLIS